MIRRLLGPLLAIFWAGGCAGTSIPKYIEEDCQTYRLDVVRVNPAGAMDRHLRVEAVFKVCPPEEGLAEIRRKHIELKHALISLLSGKTEAELEDPHRVEKVRREIMAVTNEKVLRNSRVVDVRITEFELE